MVVWSMSRPVASLNMLRHPPAFCSGWNARRNGEETNWSAMHQLSQHLSRYECKTCDNCLLLGFRSFRKGMKDRGDKARVRRRLQPRRINHQEQVFQRNIMCENESRGMEIAMNGSFNESRSPACPSPWRWYLAVIVWSTKAKVKVGFGQALVYFNMTL